MKLKNQKRIAAQLLKVGKTSVKFNPEKLSDIKEAITKEDIRGLIKDKSITKDSTGSQSKGRLRKRLLQKRKGRQKGSASKKGKKTARLSSKDAWMAKIRLQRKFIKELREKKKITEKTYREMYRKTKGNFFRSKNHIKLYLTENKLFENVKK
jgi:large subunit ribosomal protein L19e|tara:strand:- start:541 stop:999 length:459 start_codon:yes stop_codon:yes gene_type:complete